MTKRTILGIGAACAVLAGGGAAVAAVTDSDEAPGAPQEPVGLVDAHPAGSLAVFERERTAADTLPPQLAEVLSQRTTDGLNIALSRRVIEQGETVGYAVPSNIGVCVYLVRPVNTAGGCSKQLEAPGTTFTDGKPTFYGMVPDGVDHVVLTFASGDVARVAVADNAYYVEVPKDSDPSAVSFTAPDGQRASHDLFVPDIEAIERRSHQTAE